MYFSCYSLMPITLNHSASYDLSQAWIYYGISSMMFMEMTWTLCWLILGMCDVICLADYIKGFWLQCLASKINIKTYCSLSWILSSVIGYSVQCNLPYPDLATSVVRTANQFFSVLAALCMMMFCLERREPKGCCLTCWVAC